MEIIQLNQNKPDSELKPPINSDVYKSLFVDAQEYDLYFVFNNYWSEEKEGMSLKGGFVGFITLIKNLIDSLRFTIYYEYQRLKGIDDKEYCPVNNEYLKPISNQRLEKVWKVFLDKEKKRGGNYLNVKGLYELVLNLYKRLNNEALAWFSAGAKKYKPINYGDLLEIWILPIEYEKLIKRFQKPKSEPKESKFDINW